MHWNVGNLERSIAELSAKLVEYEEVWQRMISTHINVAWNKTRGAAQGYASCQRNTSSPLHNFVHWQ